MFRFKTQEKIAQVLICSTCGKPISDKAKSNVTRFLFWESRCHCNVPLLTERPTNRVQAQLAESDETKDQIIEAIQDAGLEERYQGLSLLGRGGMGAVYRVKDRLLEKTFAVKVLNQRLVTDKTSVKRFEQEAKAASALTHANLAAVYDYGVSKKGSPYIVMECLNGRDLALILSEEGYLDVPRSLDIFIQTCQALAHAHSKDVIHRDIKPSNIILEKGPEGTDLIKVVDFGIAKIAPDEHVDSRSMTRTGEVFGSPPYMSPEQCLGNKLDSRSDIYSFGCVMYETLTGRVPFTAENAIKVIVKHITEAPLEMSHLPIGQQIPNSLDALVMRCLAKDPSDRYQSADALLKDLEAIRDGKVVKIARPKSRRVSTISTLFQQWLIALTIIGSVFLSCALLRWNSSPPSIISQLTTSAVKPPALAPIPPQKPIRLERVMSEEKPDPVGIVLYNGQGKPYKVLSNNPRRTCWVDGPSLSEIAKRASIGNYTFSLWPGYEVRKIESNRWMIQNNANDQLIITLMYGCQLPKAGFFLNQHSDMEFYECFDRHVVRRYHYDGRQTIEILFSNENNQLTWIADSIVRK